MLNERREPDFNDGSLTENTLCAYPMYFIPNAALSHRFTARLRPRGGSSWHSSRLRS
ncbi:hypothetical protein ACC704_37215 [Rhizobium johnstonii]|uniref:hypothetical protein n=1 Tax=Rhizobium johnstonii TaxID=3019933 RepID=UPI003F98FD8E